MANTERGTGRITRRITPRSRSNYSNSKDGLSGGAGVRTSDKCFNNKVHNLYVVYPNSEGTVFFRPFAALDPESSEPRLLPGRESLESFGQSEWIVRVPVCKFVGTSEKHKVSYVLYGPGQQDQKQNDPYVVLYNAMYQAKERGVYGRGQRWNPRWSGLLVSGRKESAKITPPDFIWGMQGLCYAANDKVYVSERGRTEPLGATPEDPLAIMTISSGAGRALLRLLDTPRKNVESVDEVDMDSNYKYGSAVGAYNEKTGRLDGGLIIGVFRPNGRTEVKKLPPFNPGSPKPTVVTSFDGKLKDVVGYEVTLHRSIMLDRARYDASLSELQTDANFNKAQFFFGDEENDDGIFKVHSLEQKLEFLALAFRDMPAILEFAWFGRPEFRTPEVKKILSNAVSSVSPMEDEVGDDDEHVIEDDRPQRGGSSRRARRADADDDEDDRRSRRSPVASRDAFVDDAADDVADDDLDDDLGDEDGDEFDDGPPARPARPARPSQATERGSQRRVMRSVETDEFEEDDEPAFAVGKGDAELEEGDDPEGDDPEDEDLEGDEPEGDEPEDDDDLGDDLDGDEPEDEDLDGDEPEDDDLEDEPPAAPARRPAAKPTKPAAKPTPAAKPAPVKPAAKSEAVPAKRRQSEQEERERELKESLEESMARAQEATDVAAQRSTRRGKAKQPPAVKDEEPPAAAPKRPAKKPPAQEPAKPAAPESRGGAGRRRRQ